MNSLKDQKMILINIYDSFDGVGNSHRTILKYPGINIPRNVWDLYEEKLKLKKWKMPLETLKGDFGKTHPAFRKKIECVIIKIIFP